MVSVRDLENNLRNIRLACRDAIDDVSGKVDSAVIGAQAQALKKWTADFERTFIEEAKKRPQRGESITKEGHKLAEQAWFCCEVLWDFEVEAGSSQAAIKRWEPEFGPVKGQLKSQVLLELGKLLENYRAYRRDTLKI